MLGKDRMALYSFIHSLSTTVGTLYEQVAIALAGERFKVVETQVEPFNKISSEAHQQIQTIMDELSEKKGNLMDLLKWKKLGGFAEPEP